MSWRDIAAAHTAATFAAEFPHYFLLGMAQLSPTGPRARKTLAIDLSVLKPSAAPTPTMPTSAPAPSSRLVFPVKKVLATFPSMISIGRTSNNDIVIDDVQVSKFHALFRVRGAALELEDAGSVNGTRLGAELLVKGAPRPVQAGAVISLGTLRLELQDAAGAWVALRR